MLEVGFSVEETAGVRILQLNAEGLLIHNDRDAIDIISEIFSHQARFAAIPVSRLSPDFFILRTRIAGEVIQKFTNYDIRVAILGDIADQIAASDALRDFVRESNRGAQVWFLADWAALVERLER
jgi:hypothetical protein